MNIQWGRNNKPIHYPNCHLLHSRQYKGCELFFYKNVKHINIYPISIKHIVITILRYAI